MKIQVDNREKNSRIASCVKFFTDEVYVPEVASYEGKKNTLTVSRLPIGDYIFDDKLCIEYKTAIDMIGSIMDGRVFSQSKRMLDKFPYSYIMIVGDVSKEIDTYNQNTRFRFNGKKKPSFTVNAYLGAVARLSVMSKVIHVNNMYQGWLLMNSLAHKVGTNKDYLKVEKLNNPVASFLAGIEVNENKRLSKNKAVLITEKLGLNTLQDLLNISYDDLVNIKGIGSKTALKIMEVIC